MHSGPVSSLREPKYTLPSLSSPMRTWILPFVLMPSPRSPWSFVRSTMWRIVSVAGSNS